MPSETDFEEEIMDLIDKFMKKGLSHNEIISILQLRIYAIEEDIDDE